MMDKRKQKFEISIYEHRERWQRQITVNNNNNNNNDKPICELNGLDYADISIWCQFLAEA